MIVEFSVSNYKSFNSLQTLSFRTTGLKSEDDSVDAKNIMDLGSDRILKIAGIYGANASGKSNLLDALVFFRDFVVHSLKADRYAERHVNPFKLTDEPAGNAGFFQIVLIVAKNKYRYGFTLQEDGSVQTEWLFGPANKKETFYFKRSEKELKINEEYFPEGKNLPHEKLRKDALFLTFSSSYNGEISGRIKDFFTSRVRKDHFQRHQGGPWFLYSRRNVLTNQLIEGDKKAVVLDWMKEAGIVYQDVNVRTMEDGDMKRKLVSFAKDIRNEAGEVKGQAIMYLDSDESEGTKKFYSYIGQLYHLFEHGGIFVSDEIDSNFHPSLLQKLIGLFQNKKINTGGAQLLFTSHDTNLMDPDLMRRDQFYFTEKTIYDETFVYSLADLKGIRNNADFSRQYLAGLYGALPQLGDLFVDE